MEKKKKKKVHRRMSIGYMQMLQYFLKGTCITTNFEIVSLNRGVSTLLIFQITSFEFDDFSIDSLLLILFISTLIMNSCFLLLALDLICSYFPSLLRLKLRSLFLDIYSFLIHAWIMCGSQ